MICTISCFTKELEKEVLTSASVTRNQRIPQYAYARDCGSGKNDSMGPEWGDGSTGNNGEGIGGGDPEEIFCQQAGRNTQ